MNWKHLIYIDQKRITAYYNQISTGLNSADSTDQHFSIWPSWVKNKLKVEAAKAPVCHSDYEKTHVVDSYLSQSNQYKTTRHSPILKGRDAVYFKETIKAQRLAKGNSSFWISAKTCNTDTPNNKAYGHLILLEDYGHAERPVSFYGGWSTSMMLNKHSHLQLPDNNIADLQAFSNQPLLFFEKEGYKVETECDITVMYRLLASCRDEYNGLYISSLGYAIWIATS